jgi:signal transduction histidine kinase
MMRRIGRWVGSARSAISLWFLLALFLCSGVCLVTMQTLMMFDMFHGHLAGVCGTAVAAYEQGGAAELSLFLHGAELGPGMRLHVVDRAGRDLVSGKPRVEPVSAAELSRPLHSKEPMVLAKGGKYKCIVDPPPDPPLVPLGPMVWVLPFLSVLCCTVGAYVTWRMRRIEAVVNHFGAGQLAVRMASDSNDSIGRLARAFNAMADRIESLVESHQRLCADMAHELHSPLTRLMLAIPLARRGAAGSLDRIEIETGRMTELVQELLEVARAEVDPATLELEPVEMEYLLTEIIGHCAIEAAARNCNIELSGSDPGAVGCDRDLLRRAIENVLRNAVQHSPSGRRIDVWFGGDAECVVVSVRDRGPGVPGGELEAIFRPFFRVDGARDRVHGGVGLGLSIAQRAVALHRGTIEAENCSPGLRVTIRLPRNAVRVGGGIAERNCGVL